MVNGFANFMLGCCQKIAINKNNDGNNNSPQQYKFLISESLLKDAIPNALLELHKMRDEYRKDNGINIASSNSDSSDHDKEDDNDDNGNNGNDNDKLSDHDEEDEKMSNLVTDGNNDDDDDDDEDDDGNLS